MAPLRVAVFGAGRRGTAHTEAIADLEARARVVGIADVDDARAASLAADGAPHAVAGADAMAMLDELTPDVVYVTTPPASHREQTVAALEAGAHVVLEKPIALTVEDAEAIGEAASRSGRMVHVCHQLRYIPGAEELRRILDGQRIALTHIWNYRMAPDIRGNWHRTWGGGHVVEWGIHYLDLCRYIMQAEATEVHARYVDAVLEGQPEWDNWDAYSLNLQWDNGAICGYASTYALKPGIDGNSGLVIVAETGMAEVNWTGCRWILPEETLEWGGQRGDAERDLAIAFFDAIEHGDDSRLRQSFDDALETHRLVMAANQSAISGEPVSLSPRSANRT